MDIKENLQSLIDETTTRENLDKIAVINSQLDEMIANSTKQQEEYKELLRDYVQLVKTSTFKIDSTRAIDEGKKEFSFDSFLSNWTEKQKK